MSICITDIKSLTLDKTQLT